MNIAESDTADQATWIEIGRMLNLFSDISEDKLKESKKFLNRLTWDIYIEILEERRRDQLIQKEADVDEGLPVTEWTINTEHQLLSGTGDDSGITLTRGDLIFLYNNDFINELPIEQKAAALKILKASGTITGNDLVSIGIMQRKDYKGLKGLLEKIFDTSNPDNLASLIESSYRLNQYESSFTQLEYEEQQRRQEEIQSLIYFMAANVAVYRSSSSIPEPEFKGFNLPKGTVKSGIKSVDDILDGATPGRVTKGRATQFGKSGGYNQALDDFNSMGLSDVKDISGGKVGKLPDGRTVNVRTKSSDGRPTLEIYDGKNSTKIRYDD